MKPAEEDHERRDPLAAAQRRAAPRPGRPGRSTRRGRPPPGSARAGAGGRRAGPERRQRRRAAAASSELLQRLALSRSALGRGDVRVAQRERRQRRRPPRGERLVERGQLAEQNSRGTSRPWTMWWNAAESTCSSGPASTSRKRAHRPRRRSNGRRDQRDHRGLERLAPPVRGQRGQARAARAAARPAAAAPPGPARRPRREDGAQRLVAADDLGQRPAEHVRVQEPFEAHRRPGGCRRWCRARAGRGTRGAAGRRRAGSAPSSPAAAGAAASRDGRVRQPLGASPATVGASNSAAHRQLDPEAPRRAGRPPAPPAASGRPARRSCRGRPPAPAPAPRAKTAASRSSAGLRGATVSACPARRAGAGRALRSTLPFGVSGSASRTTQAAGTMSPGSAPRRYAAQLGGQLLAASSRPGTT